MTDSDTWRDQSGLLMGYISVLGIASLAATAHAWAVSVAPKDKEPASRKLSAVTDWEYTAFGNVITHACGISECGNESSYILESVKTAPPSSQNSGRVLRSAPWHGQRNSMSRIHWRR